MKHLLSTRLIALSIVLGTIGAATMLVAAAQAKVSSKSRVSGTGVALKKERLKDAAMVIEEHRMALQLRYPQTLLEIGGTDSSTIIFPAPIDLIRPFLDKVPEPRTIGPPVEAEYRKAA